MEQRSDMSLVVTFGKTALADKGIFFFEGNGPVVFSMNAPSTPQLTSLLIPLPCQFRPL
jgi:hypothetical protein